jgi:cytoskeletal protein RodZ
MEKKLPHEDEEPKAAVEKTPAPGKPVKEKAEPKQPGRMNRFVRRTTRMLVVAAVLFAAGLLTGFFAFQRPQSAELNGQIEQLSADNTDLEAQVSDLQGQVSALQPLQEENETLEASLAGEQMHVQLLSVLKDVQAAQLNLALEQVDAARMSLSRTESKLEALQEMLPSDQQGVVDGMIQRLNLVLDGMGGDAFAAQSDLDVLANSLLQLENTTFGAP